MPPQLLGLLRAGAGLVTREQIALCDVSTAQLHRALRVGDLVRVRRGVYTTGALWTELDEHVGRPRLRALAASRTMLLPHALSHDSAAHVWGLDFFTPQHPLVHVTRHRVLGSRSQYGIKHHGAPYGRDEYNLVGNVSVLGIARTAVDLAREHGMWIGTSACDAAMRRGVTKLELKTAYAGMTHWRGVTAVRQSVAAADPGAENPAESFARLLVSSLGLGNPETQFPVRLRDGIAWCDLRLHNHLFEFDGRLKYRRVDEGGRSAEDPSETLWAERTREREICDQGLGMSRITFEELLPSRRELTRTRLLREVEQTFRRFGVDLPTEVARFAAEVAHLRRARLVSARVLT